MQIEVRLFAVCRERAGRDRLTIELEGQGPATVDELLEAIAQAEPALAPVLPAVRVAVNQSFVKGDGAVSAGDEVALIPPVSGGAGVLLADVRDTPITLAEVEAAVASGSAGALCGFVGTVRDHTGPHAVVALEYEAYREMAEKVLRSIGAEVCERFPKARVAMLHRVGRLEVGEASVAIAVSSPHRAEAFDGCRHVIERLKEDAPIWKK
ncbi:MAG: molybdopterin converting factor subunit 1, partial [Myxococcota bacterium]